MNYSATEAPPSLHDDGPLIEAVTLLIPRIGQRLHASTAEYAQAWGLTVGQAKVLLKVGLWGPTPVGQVAAALDVSMPAASEIVDRLADSGFVHRGEDPADRRRVLVAPSDAGKRFAVGLKAERCRQVAVALGALPPEHRPVLVRGLEALLEALGGPAGSGCAAGSATHQAPDDPPPPEGSTSVHTEIKAPDRP